MFSVNIAKFVRTWSILKTAKTWEIHKDLQRQHNNYAENEMRFKKIVVDLAYLYVKTGTYWLVNSGMDDQKLFLPKSKTKSHWILLKRICNTTESSWNLFINIQKHLFWTTTHKKQQLLWLQIWKKHILQYCRRVI